MFVIALPHPHHHDYIVIHGYFMLPVLLFTNFFGWVQITSAIAVQQFGVDSVRVTMTLEMLLPTVVSTLTDNSR